MYRIKNTADDRTKHILHRTATKFELEPVLGAVRIRLGKFVDISDEHYVRVKGMIDGWVKNGMVEVSKLGAVKESPRKLEPLGIINTAAIKNLEFASEAKVEEQVQVKEEPKSEDVVAPSAEQDIPLLTPDSPRKGRPKKSS